MPISANLQVRSKTRTPGREVRDARKPIYMIFVLDTSGSMADGWDVKSESGETKRTRKIDELNRGFAKAISSMRRFEQASVLHKVYFQVIELNSYGKAMFPDFVPLSTFREEVQFSAGGVTVLENSLSTLKDFLTTQHMPGCNRAANIILMSDGYPTDEEGYVVDREVYGRVIEDFKSYLIKNGLKPNIDLYAEGIGVDASEEMLRAFADDGKYYKVEENESIADWLDFATRRSMVTLTTRRLTPKKEGAEDAVREIDAAKCLGSSCLSCLSSCALGAIGYADALVTVDPSVCVGCGACQGKCLAGAIRPRVEEADEGI